VSIQFAPSALEDMQNIDFYYKEQGVPNIGKEIITELLTAVNELNLYPKMGRIVPEFNISNLRELIHPPFRVVYKLEKNQRISIIRIWRSERLLKLP